MMAHMKRSMMFAFFLLAGCGSEEVKEDPKPPPPPPTRVELNIQAATDINPDGAGRPSPLLLRLYELKDRANLDGADFFAIYQADQDTLKNDLIRKQEFMLAPGTTRAMTIEPDTDTRYIAIFGAFHRLDAARWQAAAEIPKARTTRIAVSVSNTRIALTAEQLPPPAPAAAPETPKE